MSGIPKKWKSSEKAVKAVQVAFELEQKTAANIKVRAAKNGLTPSDQIRKILGLTYSPPKRPRLTVSLSADDYEILGEKFGISSDDTLAIRRRIMELLVEETECFIQEEK